MRAVLTSPIVALGVLLLGAAQPALAAPAVSTVKVSIGPDLAEKADEIGGPDLDFLSTELRRTVERRLPAARDGGVLTLVIDDAKPNRPTPQQLMTTQGLSAESFGIGGGQDQRRLCRSVRPPHADRLQLVRRRHPLGPLRLDLAGRGERLRPPRRSSWPRTSSTTSAETRVRKTPVGDADTASDRCS